MYRPGSTSLMIFLVWTFVACSGGKIEMTYGRSPNAGTVPTGDVVASARPLIAKSGDAVTLTGRGFSVGKNYQARFSSSLIADVVVQNESTATFVVPSGVGLGQKNLTLLESGEVFGSASIIASDTGAINLYSNDASLVCSSDTYFDQNGDVRQGTRDCSPVVDVDPWDLRAGVTAGSVTGKLPVNCRNGVILSSYDQGAPQQVSVDTSSDVFTTTTPHGYADGQAVRINANNSWTPAPLSYNTTYYVVSGSTYTFQLEASVGGGAIDITSSGTSPIFVYAFQLNSGSADIWDTVDDNDGFVSSVPDYTGWSANNLCGGVELADGDGNVWRDVTIAGSGAANCADSPENCSFYDKISRLDWSKASSTTMNWSAAQAYCDNLTYNGHSDWRLPTQKEIMAAGIHGIASTAGISGWLSLTDLQKFFWSSSTHQNNSSNALTVRLVTGDSSSATRTVPYNAVCVRP